MNNLRYEKISDSVISINLQNGYTIVAFATFNREDSTYTTILYLKDNTVDILDLVDGLEPIIFNANYKTINSVILKYVASLLSQGVLNRYIKRYEYMMKCFDKGNDFFEMEDKQKSEYDRA